MAGASTDSARALAELIRDKQVQVHSGDFFTLLGVSRTADAAVIREAYFALAKQIHPDAVARQNLPELQEAAVKLFKAVTEAFAVLSDRNRRAQYENAIRTSSGAIPTRAKPVRDAQAEARIFFHKGTTLMQRRSYAEAVVAFRRASELDPKEPRYLTLLGWAVFQNPDVPEKTRLVEAQNHLEAAVKAATGDADPYYYLSMVHKALGDKSRQRLLLQDALAINPRHIDAQREMRLLSMRSTKKSDGAGLFPSLQAFLDRFKKKG